MTTSLPKAALDRKGIPIATGFIDYFPDAIAAIARLSKIGNDQHNPGTPLHWDREKSGDESDCLMRHFLDRGTVDTDGVLHSTKVAWRALALLQKEIEGMLREEKPTCSERFRTLEPGCISREDNDGRVPSPATVAPAPKDGETERRRTIAIPVVIRADGSVDGCECPQCQDFRRQTLKETYPAGRRAGPPTPRSDFPRTDSRERLRDNR